MDIAIVDCFPTERTHEVHVRAVHEAHYGPGIKCTKWSTSASPPTTLDRLALHYKGLGMLDIRLYEQMMLLE